MKTIYSANPEDLQEAIFSGENATSLLSIGEKYSHSLDQVNELTTETNYIILGVTHPRDYVANLESNVGVDGQTAQSIAREVFTQVLFKYRQSIHTAHGLNIQEIS